MLHATCESRGCAKVSYLVTLTNASSAFLASAFLAPPVTASSCLLLRVSIWDSLLFLLSLFFFKTILFIVQKGCGDVGSFLGVLSSLPVQHFSHLEHWGVPAVPIRAAAPCSAQPTACGRFAAQAIDEHLRALRHHAQRCHAATRCPCAPAVLGITRQGPFKPHAAGARAGCSSDGGL